MFILQYCESLPHLFWFLNFRCSRPFTDATVQSRLQQSFSPPEYLRATTDVIFVYYEHSLFAIIILMIIRINDNSRHFKEKPKCSNIREKNLPWEIVTKVILFCNPNYFVLN